MHIQAQPAIFKHASTASGRKPNSTVNNRSSTTTQSNNHNHKESDSHDYGSSPVHGKILKRTVSKTESGTVQIESYADGYVSTAVVTKCTYCNGSKKCGQCGGSGRGIMGFNCVFCYGIGTCNVCHGAGSTVFVTGSYANESNGGYVGGVSGSVSGGYSGNSNNDTRRNRSSSGDLTCPGCHGSGKCTGCAGRGEKRNSNGYLTDCAVCNGKGTCRVCYGKGTIRR